MNLSDRHVAALRHLTNALESRSFTLIGATALGMQLDMDWRKTDDLDISISVELDALPATMAHLFGWEPDKRYEHRWCAHGLKIDVLPAGPRLQQAGAIVWPKSGFSMNIRGFRHLFERPVRIRVAPDLEVTVASVATIVLLKVVAYLDRPDDRQRDLDDIAHVFKVREFDHAYYELTDEANAAGVDFEGVPAFGLGHELGTFINEEERALLDRFIVKVRDASDFHATGEKLARFALGTWNEGIEPILLQINAFESGLDRGRASLPS